MKVFLSLGSNLGDRRANILAAISLLRRKCRIGRLSPVYETEPMYLAGQGRFYNAVLEAETELTPAGLLAVTAGIEKRLKRRRLIRNGPRTIDIDILFYGGKVIDEPGLKIPHPGIAERAFVLAPLADIAPRFVHPLLKRPAAYLKKKCPGLAGVKRVPENYEEALAWLYSLKPSSRKDYGPAAESRILRALKDPQNKYPCAHVAGSNGKTSVSMLLARTLTASGRRTGLYISPHIADPRERISVDGRMISRGALFSLFREIAGFGLELSFFEFMTALAFLYFKRRGVDFAVIEAGLGGRLDATNVIRPAAAIITGVSLEHADILGPDIASIAGHKAGIVKKGGIAVVNAAGPAFNVISKRAKALKVPVLRVPAPSAAGPALFAADYQRENFETVKTAAGALARLGFHVPRRALARAARGFSPAGRFEARRIGGRSVIFDGAHNPAALERLFSALKVRYPGRRVVCLAGVMKDKDAHGMARVLDRWCGLCIFTKPSSYRAAMPGTLAAGMPRKKVRIIASPALAFQVLLESAGPGDIAVVCGSFYLVADIKACLARSPQVFPLEMITK